MTREALSKHLMLVHEGLQALIARRTLSEEQFLADGTVQEAAAYRLLQVVESCFKLALGLLELKGLRATETYGEAFRKLFYKGVISESLKNQFEDLVKFRNRLVHVYMGY